MRQFSSVSDSNAPHRHLGLVLEELSNKSEPTRVICCGHSLGGALATLAAAWASCQYPDADVRCITLGSPRVGNGSFVEAVKYLSGGVYRLVHGWDPVPAVPPPGIGFKHVKGRMFLHNNKCLLAKRPWCARLLHTHQVAGWAIL
jgi:predicted lipase